MPSREPLGAGPTNGPAPYPLSPDPNPDGGTQNATLHSLLRALEAMRDGDFTVRMSAEGFGLERKIADTFNELTAASQRVAQELKSVGQVVGREGKTRK